MFNQMVIFDFPKDARRSFVLDLKTMNLKTKSGNLYSGLYLWTASGGYELMSLHRLSGINFTKISYPALDDSCMRFVCPVDGEDMCVYFKQVE
jgi:hypothetical protein